MNWTQLTNQILHKIYENQNIWINCTRNPLCNTINNLLSNHETEKVDGAKEKG